MKKKFLLLTIGALVATASIFAQVPTPNAAGTGIFYSGIPVMVSGGTVNGVAFNGQLTSQAAISTNTTITIAGVGIFAIVPATNPSAFNPLVSLVYGQFVVLNLNGNMTNDVQLSSLGSVNPANIVYGGDQIFGTQTGNFTLIPVPLDPATTAVLAFGLVAAFITARNRRKQASLLA